MAKSKTQQGRVPKRIAGIKVPKELRKSGGSMLSLSQTPIVREIIASGLVAAAAAMATSGKKGKSAKRNAGKLVDAGMHQVNETAEAAGAAVAAAMDKWFGGSLHWQAAPGKKDGKRPRTRKRPSPSDEAASVRH